MAVMMCDVHLGPIKLGRLGGETFSNEWIRYCCPLAGSSASGWIPTDAALFGLGLPRLSRRIGDG